MDDGLILNVDLEYTKPKKRSSSNVRSSEKSSVEVPPVRQKQSLSMSTSRDEDSGPPRKRQRVLSSLKPRARVSILNTTTRPENSLDEESSQPSQPTRPVGHVISSLFTSNPVVELPSVPTTSSKSQAPSNAPLKDASTFEGLGLNPLLISHLREKMTITKPTAVQRASLSAILHQSPSDRRDLFIQSQTGSGKTLSFLLPIIHDLLPLSSLSYIDRSVGTLAIIVAPTRELAQQISEVLNTLLQMRLRETNPDGSEGDYGPRLTRWLVSGLLVGGGTRTHDKARLRKGLPILVATPGRLLDHLQNTESFKVAKCRWLVLDEADRLMELGFQETLDGIIKALDGRRNLALAAAKNGDTFGGEVIGGWDWGPRRQTILCSATIREDVQKLAGTTLHNPLIVKGVASELAQSSKANDTQSTPQTVSVPAEPAPTFTPPSQLLQKYLVVPLKLRLVTLVALLRAILTQAQRSPNAGNKIIVFFSCTDSVDFHWQLLKGAAMDQDDADGDTQQSSEEENNDTAAPARIPVHARSSFLPNTSVFRLHGSLPLPARQAAVKGFSMTASSKPSKPPSSNSKSKVEMSILFCTSVASRGLDLPLVRAVVQYDLPTEGGATEYVHRVGRTARVGKGGESWAFVAPEEIEWVKWVEEGIDNDTSKDASETEEITPGGRASAGKLVPVDYEKILLSGFGGSSKGEAGLRATDIQLAFERWVIKGKSNTTLAQKGFQSHMRAYATHPSNEKHIFHVRHLHLGHLAKSFALRDAPSNIKGAPPQSARKQPAVPQTERMKNKAKYIPGNSRDATGANSIAPRPSKTKERLKKKLTVAERMQEVMKTQGRLTKKDGHIVSGGGAEEFQVAGTDALERLAR